MGDLIDGESASMSGSAATPYVLKNVGGVYSCSCPAWRNQGGGIDRRTCKHLKKLRGEAAELERIGGATPIAPRRASNSGGADGGAALADALASGGAEASAKNVPPILLAHKWENDIDLAGWWISEKLDGVRAYWDGKAFVSRLGNVYYAPDWFTDGLPDTPLDGELWGGRKQFQKTVSIVRRQDRSVHWKDIKYVVFDAPALDAHFEDRLKFLAEHFAEAEGKKRCAYAEAHPHMPCTGLEHLREELARVEGLGGEGLMLRKPKSRYEVGRSSTLLKVKTFHDAEARVLGHQAGAGRHKGRLGALLVETPEGTRFSVGTGFSDAEREDPPALGSVITYRFQELSNGGVPRFPSYVGIRDDYAWPSAGAAPAIARPVPTPSAAQSAKSAPSAAAAASAGAEETETMGKRRFEFVEGGSSKFWEVSVDGSSFTVTFGRIGTAGQTKTKDCDDDADAQAEANKLIAEKTKKGYAEVGGGAAAKAAAKPAAKATKKPADDDEDEDEDE
ncbi:MAG: ligase, partial [Myxococcaceae bacterium]|nr:ligase [Myxococcaceae bacterium]